MTKYIFDMDGTLTPSGKPINKNFKQELFKFFFKQNDVHPDLGCSIVTGGSYESCQRQLGDEILGQAEYVFCCNGSDVWRHGKWIYKNHWKPKENMKVFLRSCLIESDFPVHFRTANHIQERQGMINFSIVGQDATPHVRKQYINWDNLFSERINIARWINENFKNCLATVAGETGIDISHKNFTKAQILEFYPFPLEILFFGDRTEEGGNDYPLAKKVETITVRSWRDTRKKLIKIEPKITGDNRE